MFGESNSNGSAVVRHPDGSINFDTYRAAAHRERRAAVASSIEGAARAANGLLLALTDALARTIGKASAAPRQVMAASKAKRSASGWTRSAEN